MLRAQSSAAVCPDITVVPMATGGHSQFNSCAFQFGFFFFSSSSSSNVHNIVFGFKVKPQQPAENDALPLWIYDSCLTADGSTLVPVQPSDAPAGDFQLLATQTFTFSDFCSALTPSVLLWTQRGRLDGGLSTESHTSKAARPGGFWHFVVAALTDKWTGEMTSDQSSHCSELLHRSLINSIPLKEEARNWVVPLSRCSSVVVTSAEVP